MPTIPSRESLLTAVCRHYEVEPETLRSNTITHHVSEARYVYAWLARALRGETYSEIQLQVNRNTHGPIMYGIQSVYNRYKGPAPGTLRIRLESILKDIGCDFKDLAEYTP